MKRLLLVLGLVCVISAGLAPAHAVVTYTVNSVDDPGTGTCDVAQCTLAEAITAANTSVGADAINFNIPGSGIHEIVPIAALPTITDQVVIDGYSQPGATANTLSSGDDAALKIVLNGENAPAGTQGLFITDTAASGSLIRGLVINRFTQMGILTVDSGNGAPNNVNIVGNFIGTDVTGMLPRPNGLRGVLFNGGSGGVLGSGTPDGRNVISGNADDGVEVASTTTTVSGNYIGVAADGTSPLGNGGSGIVVATSGAIIGGPPNVIGYNGVGNPVDNDGINVTGGPGTTITANSILRNANLGIDLAGNGRTKNDKGDPDSGSNDLQNFPVLTTAKPSKVKGHINSTPSTTFGIDFFASPASARKGGAIYLGTLTGVTTNALGNAKFSFLPFTPVAKGMYITATATAPDGSTSEFSAPVKVPTS